MQNPLVTAPVSSQSKRQLPRIWRSPYSHFGAGLEEIHSETITANAVYTDSVLAQIATSGFNAIWVHGQLHQLVTSPLFPEFGQLSTSHLDNLRFLIARAARHGIRVYIYMQPPRGFDANDPFWSAHPEVAGSPMPWETQSGEQSTYRAMCTSTPEVQSFLHEAPAQLMRELPELGGLILITASEYPSHCHRYQPVNCPRCEKRTGMEVIGEIIQLVRDGVRDVSDDTDIIIWNWSWSYVEPDPSPTILANLPDDIILMADFERGDQKVILGKIREIDEYSLSFVGPSQRFMNCYEAARQQRIPLIAKLQFGTTHELATVPNIPVIGNLYEKARRMRELEVQGFMGCWNFGNMITANSVAFNSFLNEPTLLPHDEALEAFAIEYFPGCKASGIRRAWQQFAIAMDSFPFSIPFIYYGPMNYALSYPLKPLPLADSTAGRSWVDDERGDRLDKCLDDPYSVDEIIAGMAQVANEWKLGADLFTTALEGVHHPNAFAELATVWCCYHTWRSTEHLFRVYRLRRNWDDSKIDEYLQIAKAELENLKGVLTYLKQDKRLGYHSEASAYLFDAESVRHKIAALREQLTATKLHIDE